MLVSAALVEQEQEQEQGALLQFWLSGTEAQRTPVQRGRRLASRPKQLFKFKSESNPIQI
jgi:hypothetical protein